MHEAGEAYPLGMHPNCERAKSDMIYVREVAMMMVMDRLMDKPGWEQKVFDEEIAGKWIEEALALPDDLFLGDGLPAEKAWEDIDEDEDEDEDIDEDGDRDGEGDDEDDGMEVGNKEENKENEDDGARPMTGATSSDSWNDSGSDVRDYDWSRGPRQWKMKKLKKVLTRECMEYVRNSHLIRSMDVSLPVYIVHQRASSESRIFQDQRHHPHPRRYLFRCQIRYSRHRRPP
jgi:hypothetical protein